MKEFLGKNYKMTVIDNPDEIIVDKSSGSDWTNITIVCHGEITGHITLRSKQSLEVLHFMINQVLEADV